MKSTAVGLTITVLQSNGFARDGPKETKGESDIHSYIRKEAMFYRQAHTRVSTDGRERERREGERGGERKGERGRERGEREREEERGRERGERERDG